MTEPSPPPSLLAHLRRLAGHSAVYGSADVFTNVISFLLVPVYTRFLTPTDVGNLGLLLLLSTLAKILFRLGLDAGFFRIHYELETEGERRELAGTVALFAAAAGGLFCLALLAGAPWVASALFGPSGGRASSWWVILVGADVYLGTFAFVPLNLLRINDRPGLFSAFSVGRHTVNIVLKVVLLAMGTGVTGVLWSDLVATACFSIALLPVLVRGSALAFSTHRLKEVLAFGLPKVPHGGLVQALALADRKILDILSVTRGEIGLYHMADTFGRAVKFGMSAFEPAWQPFVYAQVRGTRAPETLARVVTYAFGAFVTIALAVAVLGPETLRLMTPSSFWPAASLIPILALGYLLHGVYLLTSIGIGIEKRPHYYPLVTAVAAAVNIGTNFLLIPRYRGLGAAWATVLAYAVMAVLGFVLSHRLYPVPLEGGRLLGFTAAAVGVFAVSGLAPEPPLLALAFKAAVLALFPLVVLVTVLPRERAWLIQRWRQRPAP